MAKLFLQTVKTLIRDWVLSSRYDFDNLCWNIKKQQITVIIKWWFKWTAITLVQSLTFKASEQCRYISVCPFLSLMSNEMYPYSLRSPLTLEMLNTFSRRHIHSFFFLLFSSVNKAWHYMWILCWTWKVQPCFRCKILRTVRSAFVLEFSAAVQGFKLFSWQQQHMLSLKIMIWKVGISDSGRKAW